MRPDMYVTNIMLNGFKPYVLSFYLKNSAPSCLLPLTLWQHAWLKPKYLTERKLY